MTILNEKKIAKLKNMLIEQKHSLQRRMDTDDEYLERGSLRDSVDELSTIDNHPADLGTELYEREKIWR